MDKPRGTQAWGLPLALSVCYLMAYVGSNGVELFHSFISPLSLSTSRTWWQAPWSLITYGFIHKTWWHFAINTTILVALIGSNQLRRNEIWLLFIIGILGGGLLFILVGNGTLIGASAGIAALIPLCIYRLTGRQQRWTILLLIGIFLLDFLTRNRLSNLPYATHLVGYAIGIGTLLYARSRETRARYEEVQREVMHKANTSGYSSLSNEEQETLYIGEHNG